MNLSARQWSTIVLLDLAIRAALLIVGSGGVWNAAIALVLSLFYLTMLVLVNFIIAEYGHRRPATVVLVTANVIFVPLFVSVWLWLIKAGRQTVCIDNQCSWVDGVITSYGVQVISVVMFGQLIANVMPMLFVSLTASRRAHP